MKEEESAVTLYTWIVTLLHMSSFVSSQGIVLLFNYNSIGVSLAYRCDCVVMAVESSGFRHIPWYNVTWVLLIGKKT